jgi:hypothetical protein
MPKAFLDTTILTNILLKGEQDEGKAAIAELNRFDSSELPVYAIKEFKSGPLQNYAYAHNKLLSTKSYNATLKAITKINFRMRYKGNTALEALIEAGSSIGKNLPVHFQGKYGNKADLDSILCDESRFLIKILIRKAWAKRRSITDRVVNELPCYEELPPVESKSGVMDCQPRACKKEKKECSLADALKAEPDKLKKLRDSISLTSNRKEDINRRQALKTLINSPKREMTEDDCRKLGDAIFAFFAPPNSTILTTNLRDHQPLASAIGKNAKAP